MEKDIEIVKQSESTGGIKLLAIPVVGSLLILAAIVSSQSPGQGGPIVIMIFLLIVFILILSMSALVILLVSRISRGMLRMSATRILYTSVALAAGVVFLLGLQTLGQLQMIDLILVLVFELLLNFYLLRRF